MSKRLGENITDGRCPLGGLNDDPPDIQYNQPRVLMPPNATVCCPTSPRGGSWAKANNSLPTARTTDHGMATLVQSASSSTNPLIHSIDGDRIIDEQRELSRLNDQLCTAILRCTTLEAHNRELELQKKWLEKNIHKNCAAIQKTFEDEMENARRLLNERNQAIPDQQNKYDAAREKQAPQDQKYQQLIGKRNETSKKLFDDERRLAHNDAELQFLRRRVRNLEDESKFYMLKNQALQERKDRLQCQLDEDNYTRQALEGELRILQSEKITNEDMRAAAVDTARKDMDNVGTVDLASSKHFGDLLKQEMHRMRDEYEKKIEAHRRELHRKFTLNQCRYKMQNVNPGSLVTRDHEEQLDDYIRAKKDVDREIAVLRMKLDDMKNQIDTMQRRVNCDGKDYLSRVERKRRLDALNQAIRDRERQLREATRARKDLKRKIEEYKRRLDEHSKYSAPCSCDKRATVHGITCPMRSSSMPAHNAGYRSTWSAGSLNAMGRQRSQSPSSQPINARPLSTTSPGASGTWAQGYRSASPGAQTITARPVSPGAHASRPSRTHYTNGVIVNGGGPAHGPMNASTEQDCRELQRLLNHFNIDEGAVIRILCNRRLAQRVEIKEAYERLFNATLNDDIDRIRNSSLKKFLKTLLFTAHELDCFELQRTRKDARCYENALVELLFARSPDHIQAVRKTYQTLFRRNIEDDLPSQIDDRSREIFARILTTTRPDDNDTSSGDVDRDARELCDTERQWREDGSTIIRLLSKRSNAQLKQIFAAYQRRSGADIEETIRMHIAGPHHRVLLAIVQIIRSRTTYFANEIHRCLRGTATNEEDLNRIIVTRHEVDMREIQDRFLAIARFALYDFIQANLAGTYRQAVLELLKEHAAPAYRRPPSPPHHQNHQNHQNHYYQPSTSATTTPQRSHSSGPNLTQSGPGVTWRDPVHRFSPVANDRRGILRSGSEHDVNGRAHDGEDLLPARNFRREHAPL